MFPLAVMLPTNLCALPLLLILYAVVEPDCIENPPAPCEFNLNKPLVLPVKSKLCPTFIEPPK